MNPKVESIYDKNKDIWGLPQEYREILLYPLKISELKYRNLLYKIFCYPKTYIQNREILKMSYLKYLLFIIQNNIDPDGQEVIDWLKDFLKHITKSNIELIMKENPQSPIPTDKIIFKIMIGDKQLTEQDFDNLREIILEQNGIGIDYVESYRPDLEKILDSVRNNLSTNFKDEVFSLCALMKLKISEIGEYTLYQYKEQMQRVMLLHNYGIYKPLEASGQIKLKNGEIKHYLADIPDGGRYGSILVEKEEYKQNDDIFKL